MTEDNANLVVSLILPMGVTASLTATPIGLISLIAEKGINNIGDINSRAANGTKEIIKDDIITAVAFSEYCPSMFSVEECSEFD